MEKVRKVTISVGSPRTSIPKAVEAIAVGGEEGVFAVYREGDCLHFLGGDDGHWWEMGAYHTLWVRAIIAALKRGLEE